MSEIFNEPERTARGLHSFMQSYGNYEETRLLKRESDGQLTIEALKEGNVIEVKVTMRKR